MPAHRKNNGKDYGKKGMTIQIRYNSNDSVSNEKSLDVALRSLKRRMLQEGVVRDTRRKEHYESKGEIRRRKKEVAIRKQKMYDREREY